MNDVHQRITDFYIQFEQAQTEEEKLHVAQARQQYYDQLSPEDQKIAREAAKPFLRKLIHWLEEEVEPVLQRAKEMRARAEERRLTARTPESADHPQ
mgnify:CR=1 FL=1